MHGSGGNIQCIRHVLRTEGKLGTALYDDFLDSAAKRPIGWL
jgi:hypothetical protein